MRLCARIFFTAPTLPASMIKYAAQRAPQQPLTRDPPKVGFKSTASQIYTPPENPQYSIKPSINTHITANTKATICDHLKPSHI